MSMVCGRGYLPNTPKRKLPDRDPGSWLSMERPLIGALFDRVLQGVAWTLTLFQPCARKTST
jgi:hypothetical protein